EQQQEIRMCELKVWQDVNIPFQPRKNREHRRCYNRDCTNDDDRHPMRRRHHVFEPRVFFLPNRVHSSPRLVGRVTPCAPFPVLPTSGAHGVPRPTFQVEPTRKSLTLSSDDRTTIQTTTPRARPPQSIAITPCSLASMSSPRL